MKFVDLLHKLGILRVGAVKGVYTNYKDMPDEMMYDNVYDKKKDLVDGAKSSGVKTGHSAIVFYVFLILAILFCGFFGLMLDFNFWFFVVFIVWAYFIYILFSYRRGTHMFKSVLSFFCIGLFVMIMIMFVGIPSSRESGVAGSTDCKSLAEKWNDKVLSVVSSDNLKGQVGLKMDQSTCEYELTWHLLFSSDKIVANSDLGNGATTDYNYTGDIVFTSASPNPADGTISPVFMNFDKLPVDPFNIRVPYDFYATEEVWSGRAKHLLTKKFFLTMQQKGTLSQATLDEVFGAKELKIFDNRNFSTVEKTQENYSYYKVDQNAAVKNSAPVAQYVFEVIEK